MHIIHYIIINIPSRLQQSTSRYIYMTYRYAHIIRAYYNIVPGKSASSRAYNKARRSVHLGNLADFCPIESFRGQSTITSHDVVYARMCAKSQSRMNHRIVSSPAKYFL